MTDLEITSSRSYHLTLLFVKAEKGEEKKKRAILNQSPRHLFRKADDISEFDVGKAVDLISVYCSQERWTQQWLKLRQWPLVADLAHCQLVNEFQDELSGGKVLLLHSSSRDRLSVIGTNFSPPTRVHHNHHVGAKQRSISGANLVAFWFESFTERSSKAITVCSVDGQRFSCSSCTIQTKLSGR